MHVVEFIEDLAVIMLLAGFISVLFHRFKQPVVLGYIIAGVIIGPHTPPFAFIHNEDTIQTLAQLGVVFLMFSLGLQFSLRNLSKIGLVVTITALAEIILMIWLGYEIGCYFHWKTIDAIFLGAILAISSTTIIVKALDELGLQKQHFVQLIYGVLIVEDILAVGLLAILSSVALSGSVGISEVTVTMGKLLVFLVVTLLFGILTVPPLLRYVAKFKSDEMLLITILGLCFGFCLLVIKLEYSIAFGAFIIGAIIAESKELATVNRLIEPIRDMFSAIFFVSIGLLLDPLIVMKFIVPIVIISIAVIIGKIISCSVGMLLVGKDGRTALRVGMGLAQIGEFSFIIASLGIQLNVTSYFLFPIAVAVSVITTFLTPYLIRFADPLSIYLAKVLPSGLVDIFKLYKDWLQNININEEQVELTKVIHRGLFQILINLSVVTAIFWLGSYFAGSFGGQWLKQMTNVNIQKTVIWGGLLIISLPFLIAIYRKIKGLSMLLSEMSVKENDAGKYTESVRRVIAEVIPTIAIVAISFIILVLSTSILPPPQLFILVLCIVFLVLILLRRWFIKLHAKLQIALMEAMKKNEK